MSDLPERPVLFLGKPISYWLQVQEDMWGSRPHEDNPEEVAYALLSEIGILRAKISFYESRIQTLNTFMNSSIEIKAK